MFYASLLLFLFSAHAEQIYSTQELINRAVLRNPELQAQRMNADAGQKFTEQAGKWDNPVVELGMEKKEEREGTTDFVHLGLAQSIPRPGRLGAKTEAAKANARKAFVETRAAEVRLRADVLKAIYAYKIANEKAEHGKERWERFKTVSLYLNSRTFASPQKFAEAAIVRTKLLVLGRDFRRLTADRKIAWNRLNLFLGLNEDAKFTAPWYRSAPDYSAERLLALAENQNPMRESERARADQLRHELALARSESFPNVVLSATYSDGSGVHPEKLYGLGLAFPLPLLNGNRAAIRGVEIQKDAQQERIKWISDSLRAEIASALEKYNSAKSSLESLKPDEAARFEKDMRSIDQSFKRGQVDLMTYIEADAEHFESLNAIFDSQADFIAAHTVLLALIGQDPLILE